MPDPSSIIGQRGRLVGAHPWAGHSGEIVRIEETLVGFGVVVRIDPGNDVPPGQEAFVFDAWLHWRPEGPRFGRLAIQDFPGGRRGGGAHPRGN